MYYIEPERGAIEDLVATYPENTPVVMLNLLRFSEQAHYPDGVDELPCSGAEAYGRYGQAIAPLLEKSGGTPVWQGRQSHMVIGPDDKDWHLIVLVRYPSVGHFVDMVSSPEYQAIKHLRTDNSEGTAVLVDQWVPPS